MLVWAFLYVWKNRRVQNRGSGSWQILLAYPNQYLCGSQSYSADEDRGVQVTVLYSVNVGRAPSLQDTSPSVDAREDLPYGRILERRSQVHQDKTCLSSFFPHTCSPSENPANCSLWPHILNPFTSTPRAVDQATAVSCLGLHRSLLTGLPFLFLLLHSSPIAARGILSQWIISFHCSEPSPGFPVNAGSLPLPARLYVVCHWLSLCPHFLSLLPLPTALQSHGLPGWASNSPWIFSP